MANGEILTAGDFGVAFRDFLVQALAADPADEPSFRARLGAHLGVPPSSLPIVGETFPPHDHPNVQLALDAYLAEEGRSFELLGVSSERKRGIGLGLGDLSAPAAGGLMGGSPQEGPVDYVNLAPACRSPSWCGAPTPAGGARAA